MSDGIKQVGLRESNVANYDACFNWGKDDSGEFVRGSWKRGSYDYIIVDEAHSSQTGSSAIKLKTALADKEEALREYAEIEGKAEDESKCKNKEG